MSRIQFWSNNRGCAAYEAAGIDWLIAHLEAERDAARLGCARLRKHNIDASARIVALEADRAELLNHRRCDDCPALARALEDAERYRWLRDASNLTLRTDGSTWTRADGNKFVSTHFLAVGDTQYGPCKSLDAAIDAARKKP